MLLFTREYSFWSTYPIATAAIVSVICTIVLMIVGIFIVYFTSPNPISMFEILQ